MEEDLNHGTGFVYVPAFIKLAQTGCGRQGHAACLKQQLVASRLVSCVWVRSVVYLAHWWAVSREKG